MSAVRIFGHRFVIHVEDKTIKKDMYKTSISSIVIEQSTNQNSIDLLFTGNIGNGYFEQIENNIPHQRENDNSVKSSPKIAMIKKKIFDKKIK